jgi:CheY-like chemotaxis protein
MDGVTLARELRALPGARALPLVLLSSVGQPLAAQQREGDFVAVLSKPLKLSQLRDGLRSALGGPRAAPDAKRPVVDAIAPAAVPLRILVAEDNPVNQRVARRMLARLGHQSDVAANGHEVLERLSHAPYDVVLMDVQMPGMDGLDASRAICARWPASERPRIIATTAGPWRPTEVVPGRGNGRLSRQARDPRSASPGAGDPRPPPGRVTPGEAAPVLAASVLRQLQEDLGVVETRR